MPILEHGQAPIAYTLEGPPDAPLVVLSNSLGTTLSMWDAQAAALAPDFRVLRYDTRGHGGSGPCGDACTLDVLGGDVLRLLDALDIERAHFCGISMGGLTGLWLGVHAGQRLRSLVVANSAACIGSAAAWNERAALVEANGMDEVAKGAAGRWFTPAFSERAPGVVAALADGLRRCDAAGYAACCRALAGADLRASLGAIAVPTLLIGGRHDPVTTVADLEFMRERIPGAQGTVLEASHLSNIEAQDAFTAELRAFLR